MSSVLKNMARELDTASVYERELEKRLKLYLREYDISSAFQRQERACI